jgi:hypothetical protein
MATEGIPLDVDGLAASLRADSDDIDVYVESLANKLELVLPTAVRVQRGRRGMFGPKLVRKIAVDAGDVRLELVRTGDSVIDARRCRLSGGIVLKSEALDMEAWVRAVVEALAVEAGRSERTRQALERLLIN